MTTTTPNLSLVLYDSTGDQAATFATWRAVIDGPASTSNFYKIDTAYGVQAAQISSLQLVRGAIPVASIFQSANFYSVTGITPITAYTTGMTIILSVDVDSVDTVTLNINSLGIKSVMKTNSSGTPINLTGSDLNTGRYYLFMYDGTRWMWVSANSADQINIVGTSGNLVTVGADNTLLGTTTQAAMLAGTINVATGKTTPVDADETSLVDSAASNVLKKLTWANLKAGVQLAGIPSTSTSMSGTLTLTDASNPIQILNANGAIRTVVLPAIASTNHLFVLFNVSTVAYPITVTRANGQFVIRIQPNQSVYLMSDGVNYFNVPVAPFSTIQNLIIENWQTLPGNAASVWGSDLGGSGSLASWAMGRIDVKTGATINSVSAIYSNPAMMSLGIGAETTWTISQWSANLSTSTFQCGQWAPNGAHSTTVPPLMTAQHAGWKIVNGRLWATSCNGTNAENATDTGIDYTQYASKKLTYIYDSATSLRFLIDGILIATHTSTLPALTGSTLLYAGIINSSAADQEVLLGTLLHRGA